MHTPDVPVPKKTYLESPIPRAQMTGTPAPKTSDDVAQFLKTKVRSSAAESVKGHPGDAFVLIKPESLLECLQALRDDENFLCQNLTVIAGTDFLKKEAADGIPAIEPHMELVYVLYSYRHRFQTTIKVHLPRENPSVASAVSLFRCANWYERECYDMLGINFEGHPNMKRILTSPDWVGHPLRRDYVFPEEYNGMKVPL